jgi:hypothetical protein
MFLRLVSPLAAALVLAGCNVHVGNGADGNASVDISAPGNAQDGRLTVQAPGFNLSMDVPAEIRGEIRADNSDFVYPGAQVGGVHVAAGGAGSDEGRVELTFTSSDGVDRVAGWYRDPSRGNDVHVNSAQASGDAMVLEGTRHGDERFTLRIEPGANGGTRGSLILSGR